MVVDGDGEERASWAEGSTGVLRTSVWPSPTACGGGRGVLRLPRVGLGCCRFGAHSRSRRGVASISASHRLPALVTELQRPEEPPEATHLSCLPPAPACRLLVAHARAGLTLNGKARVSTTPSPSPSNRVLAKPHAFCLHLEIKSPIIIMCGMHSYPLRIRNMPPC